MIVVPSLRVLEVIVFWVGIIHPIVRDPNFKVTPKEAILSASVYRAIVLLFCELCSRLNTLKKSTVIAVLPDNSVKVDDECTICRCDCFATTFSPVSVCDI